MPPKPRSSRDKHTHQSRKSKAKHRQGLVTAKPETSLKSTQVVESVKPAEVRPVSTATRAQTIAYPYVTGELKRIGILAAIVFIVLIILAIVIP